MAHQKRILFFCTSGTAFATLGFVAIICIPTLISYLVHQKMALLPSNPSYPLWRDLDLPMYQKFYFFNVTNPQQVEKEGAKPILQEVGPFVYRLNITKSLLKFRDNNTKLMFRETKRYFFDRSLSSADLNITLTTLNVPLAVAYDTLDFDTMNWVVRRIVKSLLAKQSFFIKATPDELIFKGKYNIISCIGHIIDPKKNPDCNFAYFTGQNSSNDGLWEINTGYRNIRNVNAIVSLNGSSRLDFWDGDQCNRIDGSSNGELFPPLDVVNGSQKMLQFFRSDFCRVFNLTLDKAGIPAEVGSLSVDRFRPTEHMFANATVNPLNRCYQPNPNKTADSSLLKQSKGVHLTTLVKLLKEKGLNFSSTHPELTKLPNNEQLKLSLKGAPSFVERPSGVFDLSTCHDGLPIFVSYPHFLDADPVYLEPFQGLKPNLSKHKTYIDIEPVTGTPVDFLARIQVNIAVNVTHVENGQMKSMMFPTLWQEFSIHITDKMASTITSQTRIPRVAAFSISTLVAVIGICFILYAALVLFIDLHRKRLSNQQQTAPLLSEQENDGQLDGEDNTNNNNIVIE